MTASEPGWYPDPVDPLLSRWWDGRRWSDQVTRNGTTWTLALPSALPTSEKKKRRMPIWLMVLIGLLVLVPAFLLSPYVAAVALVVLITGVIALVKGSRTWMRFRTRRTAAVVTAVAAAAFLVFGGTAAAVQNSRSNESVEAARFADTDAVAEARSSGDEDEPAADVKPSPTPSPVTEISEEIVKEEVPFEQSTVEDGTIAKGETVVTTAGRVGERTLTYRAETVDGKETKRELVKEAITVEPVTEVTSVGTYVAPPPAPAPAQPGNCHASYADACVPIDSDVDCGGGSGDGPSYFDGVARVVGPDVYDLDRNKDGYACEP
jgi:hypothetical protein